MPKPDTAVVVSYYDQTETNFLYRLIKQLDCDVERKAFDLYLIINSCKFEPTLIPETTSKLSIVYRENTGMNIGAWEYGWRTFNGYNNYIFLQDECGVRRKDWFRRYYQLLQDPEIGVVGESIAFDSPWEEAIKNLSALKYHLEHLISWGVNPGDRAAHMQSLIWATRKNVLNLTDGFVIGTDRASCISAEVAFSRKLVHHGLKLVTAGEGKFTYFSHHQWDGHGEILQIEA